MVADFRSIQRVRLGEFPSMPRVGEHGVISRCERHGSDRDLRVETNGYIFGVTRQLLVNDDLGLFTNVLNQMALSSAAKLADVLYAALTGANGLGIVMGDGVTSFTPPGATSRPPDRR
jgi:hypothetical protein